MAFCENKIDCRRAIQLGYFAEHFDRLKCKATPRTTCDNCESQVEYMYMDATEDCRAIAEAVMDLRGGGQNLTLNHFVDIFKGSKVKKVVDEGIGYQDMSFGNPVNNSIFKIVRS